MLTSRGQRPERADSSDAEGPRPSASEKHMLCGESGAQGREHAEFVLREISAFEESFQDKENRDTRHIAAVTQHIPARGEPAPFHAERLLESVQDSRAAGMEHEVFDLVEIEV